MVPLPCTGSNARSMDMQFTQVAYGGCWKCPQDWQCCSASTPCLAASQKGLVHSFGTGMGLVTLLQSLIVMVCYLPIAWGLSLSRIGVSYALFPPVSGHVHTVSGLYASLEDWQQSDARTSQKSVPTTIPPRPD